MDYENLSNSAKRGIDFFRKSLPRIFENFNPDLESYPHHREDYNAVFSAKNIKTFTYAAHVVNACCLLEGATWDEAEAAVLFAKSKKYWFDSVGDVQLKMFWGKFDVTLLTH